MKRFIATLAVLACAACGSTVNRAAQQTAQEQSTGADAGLAPSLRAEDLPLVGLRRLLEVAPTWRPT